MKDKPFENKALYFQQPYQEKAREKAKKRMAALILDLCHQNNNGPGAAVALPGRPKKK